LLRARQQLNATPILDATLGQALPVLHLLAIEEETLEIGGRQSLLGEGVLDLANLLIPSHFHYKARILASFRHTHLDLLERNDLWGSEAIGHVAHFS
jgi:hypothetical protein